MKIFDIVFALVCGWMVNWIAFGFLKEYGVNFGLWRWLLTWVLPLMSLLGLYATYLIGKKFPFVFQAGKFFLIGAFAAVIDIKIFQLSNWILSFFVITLPLISKTISFLVATSAKFWFNKHWAFLKPEKEEIKKEIFQFFTVTLVGLALDLGAFYYFTKILGIQFGMPSKIWTELSIVFAALVSAVWSFSGYKFLVFKK